MQNIFGTLRLFEGKTLSLAAGNDDSFLSVCVSGGKIENNLEAKYLRKIIKRDWTHFNFAAKNNILNSFLEHKHQSVSILFRIKRTQKHFGISLWVSVYVMSNELGIMLKHPF